MARIGGAQASGPLIATKFAIPRRRGDTLRRARLVDAIHQMIDRQLYLVVAPAGYGKTTLLVDFASDSDIPICWYALSPADAEPAVFMDYLVAAIQARFPKFGGDTRRVMAQANFRTDAMTVVAALINEVQERIPDYFAVVLDDYHEVNDSRPINDLVDALLKHAPENFKLIVSSRTMPKLQLSRLAALRQASGVGDKDLRFTTDEVRDLMRDAYQTVLPDRVVEELTARSEGWITGIILTTHTMWQGLFESMIRNSGQEQLYGYLAGEVFERQALAVQRFLLASSILDDMEPAVAGPLAGVSRADAILRQLEEGNLFVSELEGRKRVYRYHHLFRDFLRSRLDEGGHSLSRLDLERRAGLLYQQRGDHEQAVTHLLAAGAYDVAATSILAIAEPAFNRGRLETLAGWLDRLPAEVLAAQPRLTLWRAQVAIQTGELERGLELCELAEAAGKGLLIAAAKVHRAGILRLQGANHQAIDLAREALLALGSEAPAEQALARRVIGMSLWRLGGLKEARQELEASYELFARTGDEASAAYVRNDLGAVSVLLGSLEAGKHNFAQAVEFWAKTGNVGREAMALSNLGVVSYLEEDYDEAVAFLTASREKGRSAYFPHAVIISCCSLGDVYRDIGDYDLALQTYQEGLNVGLERGDRAEYINILCSMAHLHRLQGLHAKAESTLRRAFGGGRNFASRYGLAQCKLASGICSIEQGRYLKAKRSLAEAMHVFESGGARYLRARTLFHQAVLAFRQKNLPLSDSCLTESLQILETLGYHQFLRVDARACRPFLVQAARRGIGEGFLQGVLQRVDTAAAPVVRGVRNLAPVVAQRHRMQVRTLGRTEICLDGRLLAMREWSSQAARELFFYLMLHREGGTKDQLMDILAPDASPARAKSQLHVAAFRLRQALYKSCLRFDGEYYRLDPDLEIVSDVASFQAALDDSAAALPGSQTEQAALEGALRHYGGRFLASSYTDWVLRQQRELEERFLDAACRVARGALAQSRFPEAIAAAQRVLEYDDLSEEMQELIARALIAMDRRDEARRRLQAFAQHLETELGTDLPARLKRMLQHDQGPHIPISSEGRGLVTVL